jgi:hypothetical protein
MKWRTRNNQALVLSPLSISNNTAATAHSCSLSIVSNFGSFSFFFRNNRGGWLIDQHLHDESSQSRIILHRC